jgi:ferredoxin-NADP reductase
LTWTTATVAELVEETASTRSLVLDVPGWAGHLPGQHVDIRLTAEDGYQAQRSYSIAAPADGTRVVLTVERVPDGEVSPYLVEIVEAGDEIEVRGPIGGYFVWSPERGGPVQLIGGGSGVVPLMAILRDVVARGGGVPTRYLASSRSLADALYVAELDHATSVPGIRVDHTLTRERPDGWAGFSRRVDREMLAEVAWPASAAPLTFVCGPTGFVEAVSEALLSLGHPAERVLTERFGPTGGAR